MKKLLLIQLTKLFLRLHTFSYQIISGLVVKLNHGIHPKHRLIRYQRFFLANLSPQDHVLDIGCGNGMLTSQIAKKVRAVTAIDQNLTNIAFARKKFAAPNIIFRVGEATRDLPRQKFTVIILSNVLEHIQDRASFLKKIKPLAPKILIRVPLYNRDWLTLYKKELGLEWRLDKTHYLEYTPQTLRQELVRAGLKLTSYSINFSEIWAVVN